MCILNCMEILVVLGLLYGLIFILFISMLPWLRNHKVFCSVSAIYFATCLACFSTFFAFGPSMNLGWCRCCDGTDAMQEMLV
jgi:hypothetical protein